METRTKIVDFTKCNTCKYESTDDSDDPCHDCLNTPAREDSRTPVHYEKQES